MGVGVGAEVRIVYFVNGLTYQNIIEDTLVAGYAEQISEMSLRSPVWLRRRTLHYLGLFGRKDE